MSNYPYEYSDSLPLRPFSFGGTLPVWRVTDDFSFESTGNVNLEGVNDGDMLVYDAATDTWVTQPNSSGGTYELNDLNDVSFDKTQVQDKQVFVYSGGVWGFGDLPSISTLESLDDVASGATNGQVLVYDGTEWVPEDPIDTLEAMDDTVMTGTYTNGKYLKWVAGKWRDSVLTVDDIDNIADFATKGGKLNDFSDTNCPAPVANEFLQYQGTSWVMTELKFYLGQLNDVNTDAQEEGNLLHYGGPLGWQPRTTSATSQNVISDLTDVSAVVPNTRDLLTYRNGTWMPENAANNKTLTEINGVTEDPAAQPGDLLFWNGTEWTSRAPNLQLLASVDPLVDNIPDVIVTNPQDKDLLVVDNNKFVNRAGAAQTTLESLNDTDVSPPGANEYLVYDAQQDPSKWIAKSGVTDELANVGNVDLVQDAPLENQVLVYDATNGYWKADQLIKELKEFTDVDSALAPSDGDILMHDGTEFTAQAPIIPALGELTDVNLTAIPVAGQIIRYDEVSGKWVPSDLEPNSLDQLEDVADLTGATDGMILIYDGTEWQAQAIPDKRLDTDVLSVAISDKEEGHVLIYRGGEWVNLDFTASLENIPGVNLTGAQDGDYLYYTLAGGGTWQPAAPLTTSFADLYDTDVTTTAPVEHDIIQWDGTNWVPFTLPDLPLTDVNDVTITGPANGDIIFYDAGIPGWVNGSVGAIFELGDVPDVNKPGGVIPNGQIMVWDSTNGEWVFAEITDPTLATLLDTDETSVNAAANGQILLHNGTSWVAADYPVLALSELQDVEITNPKQDQVLVNDGGTWKNLDSALEINDLTDVVITNPSDGDVLVWTDPPGEWQNQQLVDDNLGDCTDVNFGVDTALADQHVVHYNGTEWTNRSISIDILNELSDVNLDLVNLAENDKLVYQADGTWKNEAVSNLNVSLVDMTDTDIGALTGGEVLGHNGSDFAEDTQPVLEIGDYKDVTIGTKNQYEFLVYDATTETWSNQSVFPEELNDHTNADKTQSTDDQVLGYNTNTWQGLDWLGGETLEGLTDTTIGAGIADGEIFHYYHVTKWGHLTETRNANNMYVSDVQDVEFTNLQTDDMLVWDHATQKFINKPIVLGKLGELLDVVLENEQVGDILIARDDQPAGGAPVVNTNKTITLSFFSDVNVSDTQLPGSFLGADNGEYVVQTGLTASLSELTDVNIANESDGQYLKFNGTTWENAYFSDIPLGEIGNVDLTGLSTGDILVWDVNDSKWVPGSAAFNMVDIGDVTGPFSTGDILVWDSNGPGWVSQTRNETVEGLLDTSINTQSLDDTLLYNGAGAWENKPFPPATFDNALDIHIENLQDGQILAYDANLGMWVNSSGGAIALGSHTDVNLTSSDTPAVAVQDGQILRSLDASGANFGNVTVEYDELDDIDHAVPASIGDSIIFERTYVDDSLPDGTGPGQKDEPANLVGSRYHLVNLTNWEDDINPIGLASGRGTNAGQQPIKGNVKRDEIQFIDHEYYVECRYALQLDGAGTQVGQGDMLVKLPTDMEFDLDTHNGLGAGIDLSVNNHYHQVLAESVGSGTVILGTSSLSTSEHALAIPFIRGGVAEYFRIFYTVTVSNTMDFVKNAAAMAQPNFAFRFDLTFNKKQITTLLAASTVTPIPMTIDRPYISRVSQSYQPDFQLIAGDFYEVQIDDWTSLQENTAVDDEILIRLGAWPENPTSVDDAEFPVIIKLRGARPSNPSEAYEMRITSYVADQEPSQYGLQDVVVKFDTIENMVNALSGSVIVRIRLIDEARVTITVLDRLNEVLSDQAGILVPTMLYGEIHDLQLPTNSPVGIFDSNRLGVRYETVTAARTRCLARKFGDLAPTQDWAIGVPMEITVRNHQTKKGYIDVRLVGTTSYQDFNDNYGEFNSLISFNIRGGANNPDPYQNMIRFLTTASGDYELLVPNLSITPADFTGEFKIYVMKVSQTQTRFAITDIHGTKVIEETVDDIYTGLFPIKGVYLNTFLSSDTKISYGYLEEWPF